MFGVIKLKPVDYDNLPRQNILCVDMQSFFASVEAVSRGLDPVETPLAVLGDKKRSGSVVLAASPALKKKYSIKTADRFYQIPDDPNIKLVEARMGLYIKVSLEITRIFNNYVPLDAIHVYSIDESWLKLDGTERLFGNKWEVAKKIKKDLLENYGLNCGMALGPNMFLSKVAMDNEGKKKGLVEWTYEDVEDKLWSLALKKCWGIGSRLSRHFNKLGVKTIGDLAHLPLNYLEGKFGVMGTQLFYHAWGVDLSEVEGHYIDERKNLGRGITLYCDYKDMEKIKTVIFELSEEVGKRARSRNLTGKTISLGLVYSKEELKRGFQVQRTIDIYTNLTSVIFDTAVVLLKENYWGEAVRKVRVSLGNFSNKANIQLNIFDNKSNEIRLMETKDYLQDKYGYQALYFGRSMKPGSIKERIKTTIGGHKA
ncbi:MAG: UV damage repair protein UvrX [Halanaerobiales bacterium]|nr:UV damage repair protein UvrX [Halanaerobiales bacterium]